LQTLTIRRRKTAKIPETTKVPGSFRDPSGFLFRLEGAIYREVSPSYREHYDLAMFEEGADGFRGGLSAENYISITKASRATATRDLRGLVVLGALIRSGERRHTRYRLNIFEEK